MVIARAGSEERDAQTNVQRLAAHLLSLLPWSRRVGRAASVTAAAAVSDMASHSDAPSPGPASPPAKYEPVAGSSPGWLRVLAAAQLLHNVQADRAMQEIWRQSRQSAPVWERDFLPAVQRYAEFVQLMPASEVHHHAHVGGLLAHTIEMVLAAMTWRNGYLLPSGEPIEVIDAQRDVWTYVVFYAALLHDIAKPITDLRITWRTRGMVDPLRWVPLAGSLLQITQGRAAPEYKVDFAPKAQRDYSVHTRLATLLLPRIAPPSALAFLALQPNALDALSHYLFGLDRDSLVAQVVRRADKASTQRALLTGSKARFGTATTVALIDLLMQALGAMLRAGTSLPLNRSGAAGWVYDGSMWFVAKRVADAVRAWIRTHAPDEAVPGDTKNDRLFDTWQEYGAIEINPQTRQAVWYVTVHGTGGEPEFAATGADGSAPPGVYKHSLTMLRFPLAKLYEHAAQYPQPMRGHIEIHLKRNSAGANSDDAALVESPQADAGEGDRPAEADAGVNADRSGTAAGGHEAQPNSVSAANQGGKPEAWRSTSALKEPSFNKPKPGKARPADSPASNLAANAPAGPPGGQRVAGPTHPLRPGSADGLDPIPKYDAAFILDTTGTAAWLDGGDDVSAALPACSRKAARQADLRIAQTPSSEAASAVPAAPVVKPYLARTAPPPDLVLDTAPEVAARSPECAAGALDAPAPQRATEGMPLPAPVMLMPKVRDLPQRESGASAPQPSDQALGFVGWLQQSLAKRTLKYNETGAAVHFTVEGMALVSPLIFKLYARTLRDQASADEYAMDVQREVIKAGWHMIGPNRKNIVRYEVSGRGGTSVSKLSAVVLVNPSKFVVPVPPANPALRLG